ncbi:hypothetical protein BRADI_4g33030v3 [Brachypodium distachyon]|uniref:AMP-dependent synthetase/ligase domain-containing protein n=1 Tax=Brachypodium distachyon TaxID=15368 RepID=A0A2K2CRX8_BRADI|nr:hypothetical protein BRADI_4g33030v3 [Brachypodium distachyon]
MAGAGGGGGGTRGPTEQRGGRARTRRRQRAGASRTTAAGVGGKDVGPGPSRGVLLGREVVKRFATIFPKGYGLTESSGSVASTVGPKESMAYGSVGPPERRLQKRAETTEAPHAGLHN